MKMFKVKNFKVKNAKIFKAMKQLKGYQSYYV